MFNQLNPPIPLHVLGKGDGYALGVIDYGQEHDLLWVTALDSGGEIWCAPNPEVRLGRNWSMGRGENPSAAKTVLESAASPSSSEVSGALCPDCAEFVRRNGVSAAA